MNKLIDLLFGDILDACKVIRWPFQNAKREAVHLQVHNLHTTLLFGSFYVLAGLNAIFAVI